MTKNVASENNLALVIKLLWLSDPTQLKILDTTCNNIFLPHRAKCMKKKLSTEASTSEIALSVFFYISLWSWFEASTANSPAASGWKAWTCAGSNSVGPCCIVSVGSHNHRNAILIWFIKNVENSWIAWALFCHKSKISFIKNVWVK